MVDRAAAGAAFEAVRRVELLLDHWGTEPPGALRSGGLGVRELKATAALLHVDEPTAALLVEVAAASGLLATGTDAARDAVWLPTDAFDAWITRDVADRWASLVRAWLETSRVPGLVGVARRGGQGPERPGARAVERVRRRVPPDGARGAGRAPAGRGARDRHRHAVRRGAGGVAAAAPAAVARRPGGLGAGRGGRCSGSPGWAGCPRRVAPCWPARRPRRPGRSRRCCPSRSTTC